VKAGTAAMLLPATSFYLGKNYAPARRMMELGIPVAIASDFNPGSCPSLNLQFAMNLGYLKYRMTPEEVLTAVTINPACAIGRGHLVGTLEPGKKADIVIWNAPDMEMLCYRFGSNLALQTIKNGELV
jgi:imidazolonepropionase